MRLPFPSLIAAALILATAAPAVVQAADPAKTVAVVVAIKTPPGITRQRLEAEFVQAAPRYQQIPGLIRKYFTVGGDRFGGIYYWRDRAAADAWFTEAWRQKATATYGSAPEVTIYDVPLTIDGARP